MRKILYLTSILFIPLSCAITKRMPGDNDLKLLTQYMTGEFNSAAQASRDSANFFNITLHMYPIWPNREGIWLYVEQSVTTNQANPYRQRIYKLEQSGQEYISKVYTITGEKEYVNAWKNPEKFEALSLNSLEVKAGCEVIMKKEGERFVGSTGIRTCPSELRGASYATSKVEVLKDRLLTWDQGFNDKGEQVWGATAGGYEFIRVNR
jgi:hypothetical protein